MLYVHALDVQAMVKILHIADHAPNPNNIIQSMERFARDVQTTTSASGAREIVTIWPMPTQSGATFVWKSGANAQAAMGSLHHMDLLFVVNFVKVPQRFVRSVNC